MITSDQNWVLLNNIGDPDGSVIDEGYIFNLDTYAGGWNYVKLICVRDRGELYVNETFIAEMDLSARSNSGEVKLATGIFNGDEIAGETTYYEEFTVWSLP